MIHEAREPLGYRPLFYGLVATVAAVALGIDRDWIASARDFLQMASIGLGLTALLYTAQTFALSTSVRVEELRLRKLSTALQFIERASAPDLVKAIQLLTTLRRQAKDDSVLFAQAISQRSEHAEAAILVLNYFERLGITVRYNAADALTLREFYSLPLQRVWTALKPWIHAERKIIGNNLFAELETLVKRWELDKTLSDAGSASEAKEPSAGGTPGSSAVHELSAPILDAKAASPPTASRGVEADAFGGL